MEERVDLVSLRKLEGFCSSNKEECYAERTYRFQTLRWQIFNSESPPFILFVTNATRKELKLLAGVASRKIHALEEEGQEEKEVLGSHERWICVAPPLLERSSGSKMRSAEEMFERLSQANKSSRTLHWVHLLDGALVWKKSVGAVVDLVQFVNTRRRLVSLPHTELSIANERVVVVADQPGAGKSSLMDSVAGKLADEPLLNRVFRFNLKTFATGRENCFHLSDISFHTYETEEALRIVAEMIKFEEKADEADFIHCCDRGSPAVVLIFDGFDEINRECQEKILKLLKLLKEGTKVLIWVTTRFGEHADLEINLDTLAVSLEPLSKGQKVNYLDKYWKMKLKDILIACEMESLDKLRSYLREMLREIEVCMVTLPEKKRRFQILMLMNSLSQIVSMVIKWQSEGVKLEEDAAPKICDQINSLDFSGYAKVLLSVEKMLNAEDESQYVSTPLNLFMLAEMTFSAKFQLPFVTNTNAIYEKFIEAKYLDFYQEKNKCLNVNNIFSSPEYFAHKEIALELLLPDETSTISLNYEKVERELLEEVGLVLQFESGFQFIHHSFTEYFFCEWVVSDLCNEEVQKVLVKRILFEPNCSTVRKFLNLQIESLEVSIPLTGKVLEEIHIFDAQDGTGTFLHLLAEECLGSIMEMFLNAFPEETAGIILKTNSNLQNVLHVACDLGFNRIIEIILNFAKNHLPKEKTERLILQKDIWDESPFGCVNGKCFLGLFIDFLHDNNRKIDDDICSCFLEMNLRDSETNILTKHLIMECPDTFDKLLEVAFNKLSQEMYLELVVNQIDIHGNTCLHNLAFGGRMENLFHFWEYAGKTLSEESLREYLLQRNSCGNTVFHEAALGSNGIVFHQFLQHAKLLMKEEETVSNFLSAVNAEGSTILHEAVSKSKVEFLRRLFDTMDEEIEHKTLNYLIVQTNRGLDTVLHLAARRGQADVVEHVCSYVKDVLNEEALRKFLVAKNSKGYTALHASVEKGSADAVRILWECADVLDKESLKGCLTETNKYGNSVFHSATSGVAAYVLKLLLDYATSVLDKDILPHVLTQDNMEGNTVLHVAAVSSVVEIPAYWFDFASFAVCKNVMYDSVVKLNGDGDSMLHLAVSRGEMAVLRLICSRVKSLAGEDLFREFLVTTDRHDNTLLHLGVVSRRQDEILLQVLEFMKSELELEYLMDLTKHVNADGETIFHLGVATGSSSTIEMLFSFVVGIFSDVEIKDLLTKFSAQGKAPLQLAYDKGDFEAIKHLCKLSGDVLSDESLLEFLMNINSFGETLLHLAVHLEGEEMMAEWCSFVKMLLSPSSMELLFMVPNQNGDTVLHYVVRLRRSDVILFWFDFAKEILSAESMKEILKKRNNTGDTILHLVASVGDKEIARYVCHHLKQSQGGDTLKWMLIQQNKNGESALHLIVRKCELAIVTFWLDFVKEELGTEFLAELLPEANSNGESVLHIAVVRDDVDIVKQLCARAVEVLEKNTVEEFLTMKVKNGSNILHFIVTRGNIIMMKEFWECCEGVLSKESLEKVLLKTNGGDDTLIHLATTRGKISMLNQTFIYMKDYLSKASFKDVMMKRNFEGNVNIHIAVSKGRFDVLTRLLDWHNELLNDEESSDELVLSTTSRGCTVLHLATSRSEMIFLNQLCDWCEEKLSKESLRILVLLPNKNGSTCLHLAASEGETAVLNRIFDYARNALEPQQLESFFKKPNEDKDTVLHIGVRRGKLSITMYLCEYAKQILSSSSIRRLLMRPNRHGKTIMDEAMLGGVRNYYVESLWEYASSQRDAKCASKEDEYRQRKAARTTECSAF